MTARPRTAKPVVATMPDFAKLLAGARLPERTVKICMRGDLAAEHDRLNDELELLEQKAVDSLAGNGGAALAAQIDALEAEMRESTYPFRLRARSKPEFHAFSAKYPPRLDGDEVDRRDRVLGFDVDAGAEPLVRASIVEPVLDDATWAALLETLTDRQFDELFSAAWMLNKGEIDVPFSRAASRLNRISADESKPPTG